MCVALAVAAWGARCSGQVVCVVPGRRGFGRKLAHGSAIVGERWRGSQFGEPDGCVWWVGSVLRRATDPVRGVPPQARTARRCTSSRYHRRLLPGSVPKGPSSCHRAVLAVFFVVVRRRAGRPRSEGKRWCGHRYSPPGKDFTPWAHCMVPNGQLAPTVHAENREQKRRSSRETSACA